MGTNCEYIAPGGRMQRFRARASGWSDPRRPCHAEVIEFTVFSPVSAPFPPPRGSGSSTTQSITSREVISTLCEPWLCPHGSIVGGGGAPKLEKLTLSGSLNIHRGRLVTPVQASFYFIARFGHNALKRLLGTVRALLPGLYR